MLPTWVGVVSALSLATIAVAAIILAVSSIISVLRMHAFVRALEQMAGPAIHDVRQLIGAINSSSLG